MLRLAPLLTRVTPSVLFCFFLFSVSVHAKKNKAVQAPPPASVVVEMLPGEASHEQVLSVQVPGGKKGNRGRRKYSKLSYRLEAGSAISRAVFSLQGEPPALVQAGDKLDLKVILSLAAPPASTEAPLPSDEIRTMLIVEGVPSGVKKGRPTPLSRVALVGRLPQENVAAPPAVVASKSEVLPAPSLVQTPPVTPPLLPIRVQRSGSGRVISVPDQSITCDPLCTATRPKGSSVVLEAVPRAGFVVKNWGNAPCTNMDPIGQKRCEMLLESPLHVPVRFDRTTGRKIAGGILGAAAVGSLVAAVTLFTLDRRPVGPDAICPFDGEHYSSAECVYNTKTAGWVTAASSVGFGIAMAFTLWPPDIKK